MTDQSGITDEDMTVDFNNLGIPLGIIQQESILIMISERENYLLPDYAESECRYVQRYMHDYKPHNGGSSNLDYNLQDGWNGTNWGYTIGAYIPQIDKLEDSTPCQLIFGSLRNNEDSESGGHAQNIRYVWSLVIYSTFGNDNGVYSADTQKEAYDAFFRDLDIAVGLITEHLRSKTIAPDLRILIFCWTEIIFPG